MLRHIHLYCKRPVASLLIQFYTDDLESDHAKLKCKIGLILREV